MEGQREARIEAVRSSMRRRKDRAAAAALVLAGLVGACCVGPTLFVLFGISVASLGTLGALEPYTGGFSSSSGLAAGRWRTASAGGQPQAARVRNVGRPPAGARAACSSGGASRLSWSRPATPLSSPRWPDEQNVERNGGQDAA